MSIVVEVPSTSSGDTEVVTCLITVDIEELALRRREARERYSDSNPSDLMRGESVLIRS